MKQKHKHLLAFSILSALTGAAVVTATGSVVAAPDDLRCETEQPTSSAYRLKGCVYLQFPLATPNEKSSNSQPEPGPEPGPQPGPGPAPYAS